MLLCIVALSKISKVFSKGIFLKYETYTLSIQSLINSLVAQALVFIAITILLFLTNSSFRKELKIFPFLLPL